MIGIILTEIEEEAVIILRKVGPDLANAAIGVLKSALGGAPAEQIQSQAEKATTLALFKASYHRT